MNGSRFKRFATLALVLVVALFALSACTGDEDQAEVGTEDDTALQDDTTLGEDEGVVTEDGDLLDEAEDTLTEDEGLGTEDDADLGETEDTTDDDLLDDDEDLLGEDDETLDEADLADFGAFDTNADNLIDENEFDAFAAEAGIDANLFGDFDLNGDAYLDQDEFDAMLVDQGLLDEVEMDTAAPAATGMVAPSLVTTDRFIGLELVSSSQPFNFDTYDLNGDNQLDMDEFNAYLTDIGVADSGQFDVYDQNDDGLLDTDEFNAFTQGERLVTTNPELTEETLGEVVDGFFDIDGNIRYVVIDVEDEAVVQIETLLGDDTLFDDEVDTILMSYDLLNLNMDADSDDEVATADLQTPTRLLLLENFGQDIPFVAQEIDAAALEGQDIFLDPARFNAADEDFLQAGEEGLLQISHFEYFDLADHEVVTLVGEDLGDIDELVVDLIDGRVAYAIVDTGGFLGIGDNSTVIPWDQFGYETADQDFTLDVDAQQLEQAPTITDDDLDAGLFDANTWADEFDSFWDSAL